MKLFIDNMNLIESYFEKVLKFGNMKDSVNRHEQTLVAILLSKAKAARLSDDYQISKKLITDKTVSHHFVDDGSRINFYKAGLSQLKSTGFIENNI